MPLSNGVVQRCLPSTVGCIKRAAVFEQQVDHGHRADGGGAVEGVQPPLVAHTCRRRGRVGL
jgi:hypothetical protein